MIEHNTILMFRLVAIGLLITCFASLIYSIYLQAPLLMNCLFLAVTIINTLIVAYVMLPQVKNANKI